MNGSNKDFSFHCKYFPDTLDLNQSKSLRFSENSLNFNHYSTTEFFSGSMFKFRVNI